MTEPALGDDGAVVSDGECDLLVSEALGESPYTLERVGTNRSAWCSPFGSATSITN